MDVFGDEGRTRHAVHSLTPDQLRHRFCQFPQRFLKRLGVNSWLFLEIHASLPDWTLTRSAQRFQPRLVRHSEQVARNGFGPLRNGVGFLRQTPLRKPYERMVARDDI